MVARKVNEKFGRILGSPSFEIIPRDAVPTRGFRRTKWDEVLNTLTEKGNRTAIRMPIPGEDSKSLVSSLRSVARRRNLDVTTRTKDQVLYVYLSEPSERNK